MKRYPINEYAKLLKKKLKKNNPASKQKTAAEKREDKRNTAALNDKNLEKFKQPTGWKYATSLFRRKDDNN